MKSWLNTDKPNNEIIRDWWNHLKMVLARQGYWNRRDDEWGSDIHELFYKHLVNTLQMINMSDVDVEELFLGIFAKMASTRAAVPCTKRARKERGGRRLGGDVLPEISDDDNLGHDNICAAENDEERLLQTTVSSRAKEKQIATIIQQAKPTSTEDPSQAQEDDDDEEVMRA